jgi:hypothetical protein
MNMRSILTLLIAVMLAPPLAAAATDVRVTVQADAPGSVIPADFLGLSYEPPLLATEHFDAANRMMVQLLRNLGTGVLRFGGNSVDRTFWSREPKATFPDAKAVLGPGDLDRLFAFSRQTGWPVILGLNLGALNPDMIADEAAYAVESGQERLIAFEIGNEPEMYGKTGVRKSDYTYADYRREVDSCRRALHARLPKVPLCGPATAKDFGWFCNFLKDVQLDLVIAARHHYPLSADPNVPVAKPWHASVGNLLSPATMKKSADLIRQHQQAAQLAGVPLRLAEGGSASHGGQAGVSDTMASALWTVDYLFTVAELGAAGVNFHGGFACRGYTTFCARGQKCHAHPGYYGMLLFHQAARGRVVPVDCATTLNVTAHAVRGDDGKLRVVLVNKDLTHTATVSVQAGQAFTKAGIWRLSAPAVTARDEITFAGGAVEADGTWTPRPPAPATVADGKCELTVPSASAALITFEPDISREASNGPTK